jgi:sigma-B regulation protein RsbU (phosphoserine phosphatase)
MSLSATDIVIVAPPQVASDDYRSWLTAAGYTVEEISFGTEQRMDGKRVKVLVVLLGDSVAPAASLTRWWRAEMGEPSIPILWLLPFSSNDLHVAGLEAGADACLARPVEAGVFLAQVQRMVQLRQRLEALTARAQEVRALNEQLQRVYSEMDQTFTLGRRIQRSLLPRQLPQVGAIRVAVHHRPRSRLGGDSYDIVRLDEHHLGFWLADAGGPGSVSGGLLGIVVKHAVRLKEIHGEKYRLVPPEEVLPQVNRELIELDLDPPALVAMVCGQIDTRDGHLTLARAGIPGAMVVSRDTVFNAGPSPGSFLGVYAAEFPLYHGQLNPGDRLVLLTDGARPIGEPDPVHGFLAKHVNLHGQEYVDALAREILPWIPEPDDCTILMLESPPVT